MRAIHTSLSLANLSRRLFHRSLPVRGVSSGGDSNKYFDSSEPAWVAAQTAHDPKSVTSNNWSNTSVALDRDITILTAARDDRNMRSFVWELRRVPMPIEQRKKEVLIDLIDSFAGYTRNGRDISFLIAGTSNLGFHASVPRERVLLLRLADILCRARLVTSIDICMGLDGLFKTGLKLTDLTAEQHNLLMNAIEDLARGLDSMGISNLLKALGGMGESSWATLPQSTRDVLWKCVDRHSPHMLPVDDAMVILAFGQLGVDASKLTNPQRMLLFSMIKRSVCERSRHEELRRTWQHNGMIILGLGKMGMERSALPLPLAAQIEDVLLRTFPMIPEVSNTMLGLGLMRWPWKESRKEFQVEIMRSFIKMHGRCYLQQSLTFFIGLSMMGARFKDLSPVFVKALEDAIQRPNINEFKLQDVARVIRGFGQMGARYLELPRGLLDPLLARVGTSMSNQEITDVLTGLATMEASWAKIPQFHMERIVSTVEFVTLSMSPKQLASSMHAMALLCFDFRINLAINKWKTDMLWKAISVLVHWFGKADRSKLDAGDQQLFAIFFSWLSTLPGGNELIVKELGSKPAFDVLKDCPTALQLTVSAGILKALEQIRPMGKFQVTNEFDGLDGVWDMNVAFWQDGKLIALVDWNESYEHSGDDTKKRRSLFKAHLYALRYSGVATHLLRTEQVRSEEDAAKFAQDLLDNVGKKGLK